MLTRLIPPPAALLIAMALTYAASRLWPKSTIDWVGLPWLAGALFVAGGGLMLAAVWTLWRAHTTIDPFRPERASHLVTQGIYRISRNPIYLGDALLLTGVAFWLGQPLGLFVLVLFVLFIDRFQIRGEEAALARHFGETFHRYRQQTRRWL
ncbi:isoprenylcysteine carboxylmethyltransferase family protein [Guyparkeria hydrothermalis]|uniref:methyltransferase family protein n=1 Tax=Guyparkeria hydrothermalis TaxID=923 RepID=UPI00202082C8|nr:isoprenylcysteine carboxylmethyltransferase family protein [Guyparkeria hydrothermalis]MCL7743391.1 isoprenylcysteine carboxylmethyltransferase family protein [Guyparkeria hydrothermalis]